ncbi:ATP-binding protein Uup [Frankliniella fusca]|uniref:ATP-binding protein Uup n=1 Tax=Frankliniella fusca TaxID=407009 RepID=A0AAE1HCI9_9NEOP|nr:ATP-binding protein Uup [Frankliniella fusca]
MEEGSSKPVTGAEDGSRRRSTRTKAQRQQISGSMRDHPKKHLLNQSSPEYHLPLCAKKTKQVLARKTRKTDVSSEIMEAIVDDPDDPSDGTPVVLSGASVEVPHAVKKTRPPPQPSLCPICQEVLPSQTRLKTHTMRHKINDVNSRKVFNYEELSLETKAHDALKEMLQEPGAEKQEYVKKIIDSSQNMSEEWQQFIAQLAKPILDSFRKPCSAMPSQQYEDQLRALNKILNDKQQFLCLTNNFKVFADNCNKESITEIVLTRLCFKLHDFILKFEFEAMKVIDLPDVPLVPHSVDKGAFEVHLRKFFQCYYLKGLKSGSTRMLARCACIRLHFIEYSDESLAQSTDFILNNASWEEDANCSAKLKLKDRVVSFFISIEEIIQSLKGSVKTDSVLDVLIRKNILLEPWYLLTNVFEEDEALVFLSDLISIFIKLSMKLEDKRLREEEVKKAKQYALLTGLKTN